MSKITFWITVGLVGVAAVWLTKFAAAQTNISGLRAFAQAL